MGAGPHTTPVSILIAALGGEGGGVLTGWLNQAISQADYPVQTTSIPGVAQRTGATTYYVELLPQTHAALAGRRPVLGLYPSPGTVDLVVASELVEAGRAIENGYVSPDRTTLIAATHRIYSVAEKSAMADGRIDMDRVLRAAKEMPAKALLLDTDNDARLRSLPLNAVMLGAIAASGVVPVAQENFRQAIRDSAIAVEKNLQGFEYGLELASGARPQAGEPVTAQAEPRPVRRDDQIAKAKSFPADCRRTVELGLERCLDYQDLVYGDLYVQRLQPIAALEADRGNAEPHPLTDEVARQLALWMTYEDIVRVADLKTRPDRFDAIRQEAKAGPDQPVRVRDYFKPGPDEIAAILPKAIGRRLARWADRRKLEDRWHVPLHLHSSGFIGFTLMWSLARLRFLRRRSFRFAEEQGAIEQWLEMIRTAAPRSHGFAMELARLPSLLKGYSDTQRRGLANYRAVTEKLVRPLLSDPASDLEKAAPRLARVRRAALADPDGHEFVQALEDASVARYDAPAQQLTDA